MILNTFCFLMAQKYSQTETIPGVFKFWETKKYYFSYLTFLGCLLNWSVSVIKMYLQNGIV